MSYTDFYHEQVWELEPSEFLRSRGIDHSTVDKFNLGYVGEPAEKDHRRLVGSLFIPYQDAKYRERWWKARPLYDNPPAKFLAPHNEEAHLFAVRATDHGVVYVCEGEIDTMTVWQVGLKAVGLPGAKSWKDHWALLFRNCDRVVLCLDPDEAGQLGAAKVWRSLQRVGVPVVGARLGGLDVNDVYTQHGKDELLRRLTL